MLDDIVSALLSLAFVWVVAFPLGSQLKRHPAAFYSGACLLVLAHLAYRATGSYHGEMQQLLDTLNKGYLATAFFGLVMFIGVMNETSTLRRRLQPIRAELSILAFIFCVSHIAVFLPSYLPRLAAILASGSIVAWSMIVAILLTIVFAVLALTSLRAFRVRMPYRVWKGIQRMSYLMVALLYLHIVLALGRSAFLGHRSPAAIAAVTVYSIIFAAYVVLRLRKACRDRKRKGTASRLADDFVRAAVTETGGNMPGDADRASRVEGDQGTS